MATERRSHVTEVRHAQSVTALGHTVNRYCTDTMLAVDYLMLALFYLFPPRHFIILLCVVWKGKWCLPHPSFSSIPFFAYPSICCPFSIACDSLLV